MNYEQTLQWLYSQLPVFQRSGSAAYNKIDLSKTLRLMEFLDNPHRQFRSIHVAGTNGKGSVAHTLAAILQKSGYHTGLSTSPHLLDYRERIKINGTMIPKEWVADFVKKYRQDFLALELSFFEMSIGMTFQYFAEQKPDIAVVETGLGGRLDSTNVLDPELSIITNISLDHTRFLGDTYAAIAHEKSGIIKTQKPVVIGERHPETTSVFEALARKQDAPLTFAEDVIAGDEVAELAPAGTYRQKNLRTVLAATRQLEKLGYHLQNIPEAIVQTAQLTGLRGRWEELGQNPKIICDTGHNEAGVKLLVEQLRKEDCKNLHIIWGMTEEKDAPAILQLLPTSAHFYWCQADIPRAKNVTELQQEAEACGRSGQAYASVQEALQAAQKVAQPQDLIFVGGSTFVVAEVLEG